MANSSDKNLCSERKERDSFLDNLKRFHISRGTAFQRFPCLRGHEVDLYLLYNRVTALGGWEKVNENQRWEDIQTDFHIPKGCTNAAQALRNIYIRYLAIYEKIHHFGEDPDRKIPDSEDQGLPGQRKKVNYASIVPMTYHHNQHNISASVRETAGLVKLLEPGMASKLEKALMSGLPNEMDFAVNVCTLLSSEGKHTLQLDKSPRLLAVLLGHIGIFEIGPGSLKTLHLNGWKSAQGRNYLRFWWESVEDVEAKKLICPDVNFAEKEGETSDDIPFDVLCLCRDLGLNDKEGQRVLQVSMIVRNLSFEAENMKVLSSDNLVLRFLMLCMKCKYHSIRQLALDTLSNIAVHMVIKSRETFITPFVFSTLSHSIRSQDKFEVVTGLDMLSRLCQQELNEDVICDKLTEDIYQAIVSYLTVHDIQLIVYTLECLYQLSELGEVPTSHIAQVTRAVASLVSLVTIEAQSYGPESIKGIKVVEHIPAGMQGITSQTGDEQRQMPAVPTPSKPGIPKAMANRPHAVPTPPPQAMRPPVNATPPPNRGTPPPQVDLDNQLSSWLKCTYEAADLSSTVSQTEIYTGFIRSCVGLKKVPDPRMLGMVLRLSFPTIDIKKVQSSGKTETFISGIKKREMQLPLPVERANSATPPPSRFSAHNMSSVATPSPPTTPHPPKSKNQQPQKLTFHHYRPTPPNTPTPPPNTQTKQGTTQFPMPPPRPPTPQSPQTSHMLQQVLMNKAGTGTLIPSPAQPPPQNMLQNQQQNLIKTLLASKVQQNIQQAGQPFIQGQQVDGGMSYNQGQQQIAFQNQNMPQVMPNQNQQQSIPSPSEQNMVQNVSFLQHIQSVQVGNQNIPLQNQPMSNQNAGQLQGQSQQPADWQNQNAQTPWQNINHQQMGSVPQQYSQGQVMQTQPQLQNHIPQNPQMGSWGGNTPVGQTQPQEMAQQGDGSVRPVYSHHDQYNNQVSSIQEQFTTSFNSPSQNHTQNTSFQQQWQNNQQYNSQSNVQQNNWQNTGQFIPFQGQIQGQQQVVNNWQGQFQQYTQDSQSSQGETGKKAKKRSKSSRSKSKSKKVFESGDSVSNESSLLSNEDIQMQFPESCSAVDSVVEEIHKENQPPETSCEVKVQQLKDNVSGAKETTIEKVQNTFSKTIMKVGDSICESTTKVELNVKSEITNEESARTDSLSEVSLPTANVSIPGINTHSNNCSPSTNISQANCDSIKTETEKAVNGLVQEESQCSNTTDQCSEDLSQTVFNNSSVQQKKARIAQLMKDTRRIKEQMMGINGVSNHYDSMDSEDNNKQQSVKTDQESQGKTNNSSSKATLDVLNNQQVVNGYPEPINGDSTSGETNGSLRTADLVSNYNSSECAMDTDCVSMEELNSNNNCNDGGGDDSGNESFSLPPSPVNNSSSTSTANNFQIPPTLSVPQTDSVLTCTEPSNSSNVIQQQPAQSETESNVLNTSVPNSSSINTAVSSVRSSTSVVIPSSQSHQSVSSLNFSQAAMTSLSSSLPLSSFPSLSSQEGQTTNTPTSNVQVTYTQQPLSQQEQQQQPSQANPSLKPVAIQPRPNPCANSSVPAVNLQGQYPPMVISAPQGQQQDPGINSSQTTVVIAQTPHNMAQQGTMQLALSQPLQPGQQVMVGRMVQGQIQPIMQGHVQQSQQVQGQNVSQNGPVIQQQQMYPGQTMVSAPTVPSQTVLTPAQSGQVILHPGQSLQQTGQPGLVTGQSGLVVHGGQSVIQTGGSLASSQNLKTGQLVQTGQVIVQNSSVSGGQVIVPNGQQNEMVVHTKYSLQHPQIQQSVPSQMQCSSLPQGQLASPVPTPPPPPASPQSSVCSSLPSPSQTSIKKKKRPSSRQSNNSDGDKPEKPKKKRKSRSKSSDSSKSQLSPGVAAAQSAPGFSMVVTPAPPQQLLYMCEWNGCNCVFEVFKSFHSHVQKTHFDFRSDKGLCHWHGCDKVIRQKWSLITHIQEKHMNEPVVRAAAIRRQQTAMSPPAPNATATVPQAPAVYPMDAAIQAIKRFCPKAPYPEFTELKEGPVTKHIRLTSALILRNMARYSALGRCEIKKHENHLAYVALSPVESSAAISNCLYELHKH